MTGRNRTVGGSANVTEKGTNSTHADSQKLKDNLERGRNNALNPFSHLS